MQRPPSAKNRQMMQDIDPGTAGCGATSCPDSSGSSLPNWAKHRPARAGKAVKGIGRHTTDQGNGGRAPVRLLHPYHPTSSVASIARGNSMGSNAARDAHPFGAEFEHARHRCGRRVHARQHPLATSGDDARNERRGTASSRSCEVAPPSRAPAGQSQRREDPLQETQIGGSANTSAPSARDHRAGDPWAAHRASSIR